MEGSALLQLNQKLRKKGEKKLSNLPCLKFSVRNQKAGFTFCRLLFANSSLYA